MTTFEHLHTQEVLPAGVWCSIGWCSLSAHSQHKQCARHTDNFWPGAWPVALIPSFVAAGPAEKLAMVQQARGSRGST